MTTVPHILPHSKARIGNDRGTHSSSRSSRSPEAPSVSGQGEPCSHPPSCPSLSSTSRSHPYNAAAEPTLATCADKAASLSGRVEIPQLQHLEYPTRRTPRPDENNTTGTIVNILCGLLTVRQGIFYRHVRVLITATASTRLIGVPAGNLLLTATLYALPTKDGRAKPNTLLGTKG